MAPGRNRDSAKLGPNSFSVNAFGKLIYTYMYTGYEKKLSAHHLQAQDQCQHPPLYLHLTHYEPPKLNLSARRNSLYILSKILSRPKSNPHPQYREPLPSRVYARFNLLPPDVPVILGQSNNTIGHPQMKQLLQFHCHRVLSFATAGNFRGN